MTIEEVSTTRYEEQWFDVRSGLYEVYIQFKNKYQYLCVIQECPYLICCACGDEKSQVPTVLPQHPLPIALPMRLILAL